jgi:hypothetical protein
MVYNRSITELRSKAAIWWPAFLSTMEADASIIPLLIKTQDEFISLLKLSGKSPFAIFDVMASAGLSGNVLLKHLVVLSDVGGEKLQRIGSQFDTLFPKDKKTGKHYFEFVWREQKYRYDFGALPVASITNTKLDIDGANLIKEVPLSALGKDVAAILLFGSTYTNEGIADTTFAKCEVGTLLGMSDEIDRYIDQRYIWVSRITGGAQANTLGQNAQTFVADSLRKRLGVSYTITRNGKIDVGTEQISFDVVVEKDGKSVGVEVSFQVTTNSTIERKANEAENRFNLMHEAGFPIAYVIDGAGNFQRSSAITKICSHSDCTVAYTDSELEVLSQFIEGALA